MGSRRGVAGLVVRGRGLMGEVIMMMGGWDWVAVCWMLVFLGPCILGVGEALLRVVAVRV